MGMDFSTGNTPAGRAVFRVRSYGHVSHADVTRLSQLIGPGGPHHLQPMLAKVDKGADFSVEARKQFAEMGNVEGAGAAKPAPVAIIIESAPMRLVVNLIVKASNLKRGATPTNTKFFNTEDEAMKWLDEELGGARA